MMYVLCCVSVGCCVMFEKCLCALFVIYCVLLYDSVCLCLCVGLGGSTCLCVLSVNDCVLLYGVVCLWCLFVCVLCVCVVCVRCNVMWYGLLKCCLCVCWCFVDLFV